MLTLIHLLLDSFIRSIVSVQHIQSWFVVRQARQTCIARRQHWLVHILSRGALLSAHIHLLDHTLYLIALLLVVLAVDIYLVITLSFVFVNTSVIFFVLFRFVP